MVGNREAVLLSLIFICSSSLPLYDKMVGFFFKCYNDRLYCNYLFICSQSPLSSKLFYGKISDVPICISRGPGSMPDRLLITWLKPWRNERVSAFMPFRVSYQWVRKSVCISKSPRSLKTDFWDPFLEILTQQSRAWEIHLFEKFLR